MLTLDTPLSTALGKKTAADLYKAFEYETVAELLRHYPRRLDKRGELTDLTSLREGDNVTVMAEIRMANVVANRRTAGRRLEVVLGDGRDTLKLVYFNPKPWLPRELVPGRRGMFAGKVTRYGPTRQLTHPIYVLFDDEADAADFAGETIPIYPATAEVRTWEIAKAIKKLLDGLDPLPDPLPESLRAEHRLVDLDTALRRVHRPGDRADWSRAIRRLKWDEALGLQLALAQRRAAAAANPATPRKPKKNGILDAFDARLPFQLTAGQREVGETIRAELSREHPMHRLLQGEVGSGKTVVALRAMLQVVDAGGQAALLAPTEVLAMQHARSIEAMLGDLALAGQFGAAEQATRAALLTGSLSGQARRQALLDAASGAAGIVIGTHALIQDQVSFADLGLVVVDEQHRFGVEQRDALRGKAAQPPHVLVMTATPIPRTVAMTVFGDLDTSTLTELPVGRAPISTTVVPAGERPAWLDRAWARACEEVQRGGQVYVVCPRIGEGDEIDLDTSDEPTAEAAVRAPLAVEQIAPMLAEGPLTGLRLATLHGRLAPDEKDRVMREFVAGDVDVLVSTTVIEVGVDVPNATMMIILDADRFGVSQLHQLRGRVGRGGKPGICLLITDAPADSPSRTRLDAVAATTDGFELARLDVEQRREGDVLGATQSGRRSGLKLLSLLRDEELIAAARAEAAELIAADPGLARHPQLAAQVDALIGAERAEYLEKA